jgi:nucleotide-binding universal stress UspA family protein
MYSRMLIPLDESIIAEQVLPYARYLAKALTIPVELLEVVDSEALKLLANPERGRYIDTVLADRKASGRNYLETIAGSFQGARVTFSVENGKAEELIIDKAAVDKDTLIVMATHGRSGIQRWQSAARVYEPPISHSRNRTGQNGRGSGFDQSHCSSRWLAAGGEDFALCCRPRQKNAARSNLSARLRLAAGSHRG